MQISNCEVSHPYFGSVEGLLTSMITGISLQTKLAVGCWLYEIKKQMTSFFFFFFTRVTFFTVATVHLHKKKQNNHAIVVNPKELHQRVCSLKGCIILPCAKPTH